MGTKYKIESGVQMSKSGRSQICKYPFAEMKVGDSFAVAASDLEKTRTAASYFGRHNERKYSVCRVDPIKGEYRCWRIA